MGSHQKVYYWSLQIVYKRETISLHLNRELDSAAASLLSILFVNNTMSEDRWLDVIVLKKRLMTIHREGIMETLNET